MNYILRFEVKSRYFGFTRVYYKEFNKLFDIFVFLTNNDVSYWKVYQAKDISYSELIKEEK